MRSYAIDTLFDSEYYIGDTEEIETTEALQAPDSEHFITAIKKEVHSLISETRTLQPLTRKAGGGYVENTDNKRTWKIRTTLKCKRKKKSNGEPDKHKARAAARGDTLRRAMTKADVPLPASYNPTVMPLTFAFLQLAVIQQLHMATMNIKSAYLNAPLPPPPRRRLDRDHTGTAYRLSVRPRPCTRIPHRKRTLRLFYLHYKTALLAEGYSMFAFDNCLFYRIAATETTYIIVYVDDTLIFSNSLAHIDSVIANVGKHYEVTLDRDATSFLGLNLAHSSDGTVTITQPKLLTKLFSLYSPRKDATRKPSHPYRPLQQESDPAPQPTDH